MQGSVWACQTVRILYWAVCAYRALDGSGLFADETAGWELEESRNKLDNTHCKVGKEPVPLTNNC